MFSGLIQRQESLILAQDEIHGGPSLVLTADPKPRLRWTADLHERFVDAIAHPCLLHRRNLSTRVSGATSSSVCVSCFCCISILLITLLS
ncbi:uncharacterized protein A4U43_C06F10990 [Asparagus officinalis]|uniref:Uncharacterized protein n=1 Tax=Asparagus officinalis TaxID=4686 RepID=A0A5P1EM09_ASPOF|nr:uncharacterized protein A4U43_C06F10990 [Asparagus officinalis]